MRLKLLKEMYDNTHSNLSIMISMILADARCEEHAKRMWGGGLTHVYQGYNKMMKWRVL